VGVGEEARDFVELHVEAQQRAALAGGDGAGLLQLRDVPASGGLGQIVGNGVGDEVALVDDLFVAAQVEIQDTRF